MDNRNSYELITPLEMDVRSFNMLYDNVLVRFDPDLTNVTNSGILVPKGNWEGAAARNAVRVSTVVKVPKHLYWAPRVKAKSMQWKTRIEVKEGDVIVSDHMESNNAFVFTWNGEYFKTIRYSCIDAVKRGGDIIPINGNLLMEKVEKEYGFGEFSKKGHDGKTYRLKYAGERNTSYIKEGRFDFRMDLKEGDIVTIDKQFMGAVRPLEQKEHLKVSEKELFVAKRYMVAHIERV